MNRKQVALTGLATLMILWGTSLTPAPARGQAATESGGAAPAAAAPAAREAGRGAAGVAEYIAGIDALDRGDYAGAAAALTEALRADPDNGQFVRARGVAETLAENFPPAVADLQRAIRLSDGQDREAELWLGAAYTMSHEVQKGSAHFPHDGDIPTDYAYLVHEDMAQLYASSRYDHSYYDREKKQQVPANAPVKTRFLDSARAFARRNQAQGPAARKALLERVQVSFRRQDWASALRDVQTLRQQWPEDVAVQAEGAVALLGAGDATAARAAFTRALTAAPLWSGGYLGRARAAALTGDGRRALADLDAAADAGEKLTPAQRDEVTRLAGAAPAADAPARFAGLADADAAAPDLLTAAVAVQKWASARRSRYDEAYQDRVRVLAVAARQPGRRADALDLLAWFRFRERDVPLTWDGPRARKQVRPQSAAAHQQEIQDAIALADAALKIDPRRAGALATRGWALYDLGRTAEAEAVADRGLEVEPRNVETLDLKARRLNDAALALAAAALGRRAPHSESHTEQRSDGTYRVTTTYPPTDDAVAAAQGLEGQAFRLAQQAKELERRGLKVREEVVPALMKSADESLRAGDAENARRQLEEAYRCWPDAPGLFGRLADACGRLNDAPFARAYATLSSPMLETTASGFLSDTYEAIARTAYRQAAELLNRAAEADPADARVFAYRAIVESSQPFPDAQDARNARDARGNAAARRHLRAALALEEARARLRGTSFSGPPPAGRPVDLLEPADVALSMLLYTSLGNAELAAHNPQAAVAAFDAALAIEGRLEPRRIYDEIPGAIVPDPEARDLPRSPSPATFLAEARVGKADALIALGRPDPAAEQYARARAYLANWPITLEGRETLYAADARAHLGLAQAAYAAGDIEKVFNLMFGTGADTAGELPPELKRQAQELGEKVQAARMRKWNEEADAQLHQTPEQMRRSAARDYLKQLEQQRDAMKDALKDNDLPPQIRRSFQNSISQLDREIERRRRDQPGTEKDGAGGS